MRNVRLSPMEIEEIQNRTRALSEEELRVVIANIRTTDLYQELDRRLLAANRQIEMINEVVNRASEQEPTLLNMQMYIRDLKEVLRV